MNINEAISRLQNLTNTKFTQTELGVALEKTRSDINAKAKRGTELKLSDIQKIENYIHKKYNLKIDLINTKQILNNKNSDKHNDFIEIISKNIGVDSSNARIITACGDSMHPTIEHGDNLLIDTSKKEIYDGKIYCVEINKQLQPKRLQIIPPDKIKVISDNKDKYDSFYIDNIKKENFSIVGEVCWWGRTAR